MLSLTVLLEKLTSVLLLLSPLEDSELVTPVVLLLLLGLDSLLLLISPAVRYHTAPADSAAIQTPSDAHGPTTAEWGSVCRPVTAQVSKSNSTKFAPALA